MGSETIPLVDYGIRAPADWYPFPEATALVKRAVVSLREKNAFGPRNRNRIVFRASELGDVAAYRGAKDEPGGCARKVLMDFYPDKYPRKPLDAEAILNFTRGDEWEDLIEKYLVEANMFVDSQVKLGCWGDPEDPKVPEYYRGDARFPDRSGGLVRGKADFLVVHPDHPEWGIIPCEVKTTSTYMFGSISREGPKGDNAYQIQFYGREMGASHVAICYINKESGDLVFFWAETDTEQVEAVLKRAEWLRGRIEQGKIVPRPKGVKKPENLYDRVWPCFTYSPKKKRAYACPFFEPCWGVAPPDPKDPPPKKKTKRKTAKRKTAKRKTTKRKSAKSVPKKSDAAQEDDDHEAGMTFNE